MRLVPYCVTTKTDLKNNNSSSKTTLTHHHMNDKRSHAGMRQVLYCLCLNSKQIFKNNNSL